MVRGLRGAPDGLSALQSGRQDGAVAEPGAHAVHGAGDRTVALRLQIRLGPREEGELAVVVRSQRRQGYSQQARRGSPRLAQLPEELSRHSVDGAIGFHGPGYRATRLPRREVGVPQLDGDGPGAEALAPEVGGDSYDEAQELAV